MNVHYIASALTEIQFKSSTAVSKAWYRNYCEYFFCKSMYKSHALDIGAPRCVASCGLATQLRLSCGMSSKAGLLGTNSRSTMVAKSGRLWYSRFLHNDRIVRQRHNFYIAHFN